MDALRVMVLAAAAIMVLATIVFAATPKVKFAIDPVFGDSMVLQRGEFSRITGTAPGGSKVTVKIAGQEATAAADKNGVWRVNLALTQPGGPHEMTVACGKESITVKDILIGDVWFCSGQSNMEMRLYETTEGADELKNFKADPNVRLFLEGQRPSPKPIKEVMGAWTVCDAAHAKDFSAVGYFFGKKLQAQLNVPIGLIDSSWGGTSIEIWMDENLVKNNPETAPIYDRWMQNPAVDWKLWKQGKGLDYELEITDIKFSSIKPNIPQTPVFFRTPAEGGFGGGWEPWAKPGSTAAFDITGEKNEFGKLHGVISLGAWGGVGSLLDGGREIDLSAFDAVEFKVRGKGTYSVAMAQKSIEDYNYYGSKEFTATKEWKKYTFPFYEFKQGNWGTKKDFTRNAITKLQFNIIAPGVEMAASLYNGMVLPFTPMCIKGAIWYQGENNVWRGKQYKTLLPMLINNWRKIWDNPELGFYAVQLVNFMPKKNQPGDSAWAELREAQMETFKMANAGTISAIDLGDENDIHPKLKKEVGDRLAYAALKTTYGKEITGYGPMYESMKVEGNRATITFENVGKGLKSKGELKGFAVAGEDKQFKWAKAEIKDNKVVVWSDDVMAPAAVRYAWADSPDCPLYNEEGFAAFPFRTDEWVGIGDNNR
ncbi:MAG: CIA30 family protein [Spirochaetia bacterium]|nr:CIA30 family protein [Spirochaetia bacterium]